jgi:hypothetical protein
MRIRIGFSAKKNWKSGKTGWTNYNFVLWYTLGVVTPKYLWKRDRAILSLAQRLLYLSIKLSTIFVRSFMGNSEKESPFKQKSTTIVTDMYNIFYGIPRKFTLVHV